MWELPSETGYLRKIEEMVEVAERRRRRGKQLLDDIMEKRRRWKLKKEALARTLCRTGFGRGCGSVGKADIGMNELVKFVSTFMIPEYLISSTERTQLEFVSDGR